VGKAPGVYLDPIENGYKVVNNAKTVAKAAYSIEVSRVGNTITVNGHIGIEHAEQAIYKNIDDPVEWSGRALQFFLAQRGISVSGGIRAGKKPENAVLLAKADSRPVSQHIADMMKFSNNYVAEMLTKNLALANGETPASLSGGMKLIRDNVEAMGIDGKRFTLLNPSGLSRKNRIRPSDLAMILVQAQKSFPWFAEFLTALPIAGQDGTLKKRMKDGPADGWVRAKTGQLAGVAALAGYAGRKDGSVRAFAFIFNGKNDLGESARHLFDALATQLVQ
jgi:D-alanyl-D-alanine carboxypeptidase/D-alanyl-D-alanine-endopeptidase (penicillin-binding protein 4)